MDKETWSMLEGGDNVAEQAQAFPGGGKPLVALGGYAKPSQLTVERPWEETMVRLYATLWPKVGQAEMTVSYQARNAEREPFGPIVTYTGVLGSIMRPNYKEGTSEEARIKIVVDLNGEISST
jgi:hypothetical protein